MTAIVTGQEVQTHTGMQIDSKVAVNLSQNNSWTVPSGKVFKGHIFSSNSTVRLDIDNQGYLVSVPDTNSYLNYGACEFGPGTVLACRNSSWLLLRGVLYNNGGVV